MDQGNEQTAKNLSLFNIFTTPYKTLNNHAITADVLIPKNIQPGKHPLLVRLHGGCLVSVYNE
jgi:cephalosporin-C deacetylase-like acetyl esterase